MPRINAEMANWSARMSVDEALVPRASFDILSIFEGVVERVCSDGNSMNPAMKSDKYNLSLRTSKFM